jgi:SAM-dependent methyltransferase
MSKYEDDYTGGDSSMFVTRAAWIDGLLPDKNVSICDVGCGNGQLLVELRNRGFADLLALDPSPSCIKAIHARGIDGLTGSIFTAPQAKKFDAVILSGVLEHICDVPGAMQNAAAMTKPGGFLFVFAPDASRYADYDTIPYDYLNIEHLNHFDDVSLINLGLRHGFSVSGLLKTDIALEYTRQPVIFCAYRNDGGSPGSWQSRTKVALQRYLDHTDKCGKIDTLIERMRSSSEAIVIWGAGNYTGRLLADTRLGQCKILMFVDNDKRKQGTTIRGIAVRAPEFLLSIPGTPTIAVAVAVFPGEIMAQIKQMGLKNKVVVLK